MKISDFAFCQLQEPNNILLTDWQWKPPEILRGNGEYSDRSDVYSLAIVINELVSHAVPFQDSGLDQQSLIQEIIHVLHLLRVF